MITTLEKEQTTTKKQTGDFFDFVLECAQDKSLGKRAFRAIREMDAPELRQFFADEGYEVTESNAAKLVTNREIFEEDYQRNRMIRAGSGY